MNPYLLVALGGALGSVARYGFGLLLGLFLYIRADDASHGRLPPPV